MKLVFGGKRLNKTIWIWNHYAAGMFFQKSGRHHWFAKYLKRSGYNVKIFCASTRHSGDADIEMDGSLFKEDVSEGIDYVFVKARKYEGNGISRILNMASFYRNVQKAARQLAKRDGAPDVILASSVHPLTLVAGIKFGKRNKIPCICEVRDLWPETLVVMNIITMKNPLCKILYQGEKWIYQHADALIFTMEGGYDYITDKGWATDIKQSRVFYINNGIDLETYKTQRIINCFDDYDLDNTSFLKLGYVGSIRESYNIGRIVEVAQLLRENNFTAKLIIYGDGPDREVYEQEIQSLKLDNIIFKGRVEKKYVPYILSKMDILLFNDIEEMEDLAKYGFSQNKFFEYLASGKPILSTFSAGKYDLISQYGIGIAENIKSTNQYFDCIQRIVNIGSKKREEISENAENYIEEYDFSNLTNKLIGVIEEVYNTKAL